MILKHGVDFNLGKITSQSMMYIWIFLVPPSVFASCFIFLTYYMSLMSQTRKCVVMTTQVNYFCVCFEFKQNSLAVCMCRKFLYKAQKQGR